MDKKTCWLVTGCVAIGCTQSSHAGVTDWLAAANGSGAGYTNSGIDTPIVDDIGSYDVLTGGGVTYEFIVNASNLGSSSALIGFRDRDALDAGGAIKWEQWPDSLVYGVTLFEVADLSSVVANTPDVDTHLAFVADGFDMYVYVNGEYSDIIFGGSLALSGEVGIGQAYDATTGSFDYLTGTILGVAVYDTALLDSDITDHFDAFVLATALPGDTDGDGDIDNSDLQSAISNFTGPTGSGKTAADGDSDGDGDVDNSDLQSAIAGFTGPNSAAVPEPTSLSFLGLCGLSMLRRRRSM